MALELTERVRRLLPDIGVLLVSGYRGESMPASSTDLGTLTFLAKPFAQADLANAVRAALRRE